MFDSDMMCPWCEWGTQNPNLPSLHQECVSPDFRFPVGLESEKTKRTKFMGLIRPFCYNTLGTELAMTVVNCGKPVNSTSLPVQV